MSDRRLGIRARKTREGEVLIAGWAQRDAAHDAQEERPVPMAEELFLWAWLMAQTKQAIRLEAWLEQREQWLAEP